MEPQGWPRSWWGLLLLSLLLGGALFGALPWALAWAFTPGPHAVLPLNVGADYLTYQSQYRDIYEGEWLPGDAQFWEHRTEIGAWAPFYFGLYGKLSALLGSLNAGIAAVWVAGWTLNFLLVFLLLRTFIRTPVWAIAGTLAVLVSESIIRNPLRIPVDLLYYSQRHALEFVFLFLPLLLLWRALAAPDAGRSWKRAVVAGLAGGTAFYVYIFHALLFVAGTAACLLFFWPRRKIVLIAGGVALAASLPYWLLKHSFDLLPAAADWYARAGMAFTREPVVGHSLILLAGLGAFALLARRRWSPLAGVLAAFLLATVALLNLHVIVGKTVQPEHWFLRSGRMLLMMAAVYALHAVRDWPLLRTLNRKAVGAGMLAMLLIFAGASQARAAVQHPGRWAIDPAYADALAWIERSIPDEGVIASPSSKTSLLVTALTSKHVLLGAGFISLAPERELIERLILAFRLFGAAPADVRRFMDTGTNIDEHIGGNIFLFAGKYVFSVKTPDGHPPPELLDSIVRDYCGSDAFALLTRYRVDYAIDGPAERALGAVPLEGREGFERVYGADGVAVYRVKPAAVRIGGCP